MTDQSAVDALRAALDATLLWDAVTSEGFDIGPTDCERIAARYAALAASATGEGREYKTGPCIHGDPCRESMCIEYGRWTDDKDLRAALELAVNALDDFVVATWHVQGERVAESRRRGERAIEKASAALAASATDEHAACREEIESLHSEIARLTDDR